MGYPLSRINDHVAEVADALWYCFYACTSAAIEADDVFETRLINARGNNYVLNFDGHINKHGEVDYVTVKRKSSEVNNHSNELCKVRKPKTYAALQEAAFFILSYFHVP